MCKILYMFMAFWPVFSVAQNIELKRFDVFSDGQYVHINMTLEKGSICDGIKIYRSSDSNYLEVIGFIDGICGSADEPVGYSYVDSMPLLNKKAYYAVKAGVAPVTDVRSVFFTRAGTGPLVYPNPAQNAVTFIFNDAAPVHDLFLYNVSGVPVLNKLNISGANAAIPLSLPAGVYIYRVTGDDDDISHGKLIIID